MRSTRTSIGSIAVWLPLAAALLAPSAVVAQSDPDLREILPYLMLVIDTSGSMERLPACNCSTPACLECLPDCSATNIYPGGIAPVDVNGHETKKNRWAVTLEALTGTFQDFQCEPLDRTAANGASYDIGYYLKYHQPWHCSTAGTACAFDSTESQLAQNSDGILDRYSTRIRFGLMTFDGWDTYVGASPTVEVALFDTARSNDVQGLWSYGGGKTFRYPGCSNDYMIDSGARSGIAVEGSLVSMDSCSGGPLGSPTCPSWCSNCPNPPTQDSINLDIQQALLSARPYGGTPIAGSLDDLKVHFQGLNDQFGGCRHRFALLMTDGYPNADFRDVGCDCAEVAAMTAVPDGGMPLAQPCGGDPADPKYDPDLMHCPYKRSEDLAYDLVHAQGGVPASIERLFVVGLAVDDQNVSDQLNLIAGQGCTESNCAVDGLGNAAFFASDFDTLIQSLDGIFQGLIEPISRSVPAFAVGNREAQNKQYQISTGFEIATATGEPWTGVIERRRFQCSTQGALDEVDLDVNSGDLFHVTLNNNGNRKLWTAANQDKWLTGNPNGPIPSGTVTVDTCDEPSECPLDFADHTDFPLVAYGLPTNDDKRRLIVDWMHGSINSPRANKKLGAIYHSSPVIVGPPRFDTADEAFNLFRQSSVVANRPVTMYVGSNDGILHAFSVEDYQPSTGTTYGPGEEMWGFIPPMVFDELKLNLTGHQMLMDGTPVVKNVYFSRTPGTVASPSEYHTVLITGMREGGNGYVALEVTDPSRPRFLWQFTDPQMGKTFGQAAIAQAVYMFGSPATAQNRAVAILPGGVGVAGGAADCASGTTPSMRQSGNLPFGTWVAPNNATGPAEHRFDVRCWTDVGRALYFVDVQTGTLVKKIYDDGNGNKLFPSPIVSTPAIYQADVGTLTTRAYVVDADGVIWRIDLSAINQGTNTEPRTGWTARPFHDIFWDGYGNPPDTDYPEHLAGELTYEQPMLSIDNQGRVVVIAGTGDNNNFVKPDVRNRVVSLTEVIDTTKPVTDPERFKAAFNWEMRVKPSGRRLVQSELVTGTMGLFNGTLFFGTFIAVSGGNACDLGKGRIHAVNYLQRDTSDPNGSNPQTFPPVLAPGIATTESASAINQPPENAVSNFMVMGLGLTQRPTCTVVETDNFDVFGQDYVSAIQTLADPAVYLVAQGSGTKGQGTLLQEREGSQLGSIELRLNKPGSLSRVISWATSVD